MFHCELHRLEGNEQLCSDWRDLLNRVRPDLRLFGPEWFSIWDRTIGSHAPWTGEMHVVAVYDDGSPTPCGAVDSGNLSESSRPQGPGLQQIFNADLQPHANRRLCGVLPIGHPKVGLLRVNAMAGYFQPWRLALADQSCEFAVGRALGWFLVELGWSVMQLGPWPLSHEVHRGILSALGELEMPMRKQSTAELAIAELPPTWEQCQTEIVGRKFLRRVSNYESKLAREHRVEVRHVRQPSPFQTTELLTAFAQVEQRSWLMNDPHGRPRFVGPVERGFWAELIQQWLAPQNFFDAWLMQADGQPISFVVAATVGSTRYVIANNYDEAWSDYRVGSQLYRRLFEEGYSRGVTRYDFGTNELHYKQRWGAKSADRVETCTVAINHMVSGFWNAGVKLKGLLDGGLWGRPAAHEQLASGEPVTGVSERQGELVMNQ